MRRTSGVLTMMLVVAMVVASPAQAQGVETIRQGARVRVEMEGQRMSGILADREQDTLWIRVNLVDTLRAAPLAGVERLEVSREQLTNAGSMALLGFALGAIPGVAMGTSCDCGNRGAAVLAMGVLTGGLGAALGAAVGASSRHDVWEVVPLAPQGTTVAFRPGVTASLHLRFR